MTTTAHGFSYTGIVEGYVTAQNGQYLNRTLGLSMISKDQWGNEKRFTQNISIQEQDAVTIEQQAKALKGKICSITVVPRAKTGGKNGSWLSVFAPVGSQLQELK